MSAEKHFRGLVEKMQQDEEEYRKDLPPIARILIQKYQELLTSLIEGHLVGSGARMDGMTYARQVQAQAEERQRRALQEMVSAVTQSERGAQFFLCEGGPADGVSVSAAMDMPDGAYTFVADAVYQRKGMTLVYSEEQTKRARGEIQGVKSE